MWPSIFANEMRWPRSLWSLAMTWSIDYCVYISKNRYYIDLGRKDKGSDLNLFKGVV